MRSRRRPQLLVRAVSQALERRLLLSTYAVTNFSDSGPGSLRDAITNSTADTIGFSSPAVITLQSQLEISRSVSIYGSGTITGNNVTRIFQIDPGATVQIHSLLINRGAADFGAGIFNGGTLSLSNCTLGANAAKGGTGVGGAIANSGTLTLDTCTFTGNTASSAGGAIVNAGTLTVTGTTFSSNSAPLGGAIENQSKSSASFSGATFISNSAMTGGAIHNAGGLSLASSTADQNTASGSGGAIDNAGTLTVNTTTLSKNTAAAGGGIANDAGTASVVASTLSGNSASGKGGGIENAATLTMADCTLSGDSASAGGGIDNAGMLTLSNCTISANTAATSGGGLSTSSSATLFNTIVAGNTLSDHTTASDIAGPATGRFNLIGTGGSGSISNAADGNQTGVADPHLAPLGNDGGPTMTMALLPGSSAIDAGFNALANDYGSSPAAPLLTDQRGFPRNSNGTVDMGAVEAQRLLVVNDLSEGDPKGPTDMTFLRALQISNEDNSGDVTIRFDPSIFTGTGPAFLIDGSPFTQPFELSHTGGSITIDGPGASLLDFASSDGRVFLVDAAVTAQINNVTITHGTAPVGENGGGILNLGTLTLANDTITNCAASSGAAGQAGGSGGGVYSSGALSLSHDTFTGNAAGAGGAAGNTGGSGGPGGDGGAVCSTGPLTVTDCTFTNNSAGAGGNVAPNSGYPFNNRSPGGAGGDGGGIAVIGSKLATLQNVTLVNNQAGAGGSCGSNDYDAAGGAGGRGGGFFSAAPTTLSNSFVSESVAGAGGNGSTGGAGGPGGAGGGAFVAGSLMIENSTFASNTAGAGGTSIIAPGASLPTDVGASGGNGGGIAATGAVTADASTFNNNVAGAGGVGGEAADGGAGGLGGGIAAFGALTLTNCTLGSNVAGAGGAGGPNPAVPIGTAGGNGGGAGSGGAAYVGGSALLINDTIAFNHAAAGGSGGAGTPRGSDGANGQGGGIDRPSGSTELRIGNTIVAANVSAGTGADVFGNVVSLGHNLVGLVTGSGGWNATDRVGTPSQPIDPKLAALAGYGGPTLTLLPLANSPAVDAGDNALVTSPPFPAPPFVDQRGLPRIAGGAVDIGADETQPVSLVVNTTTDGATPAGRLTLRAAVGLATTLSGNATITFAIPATDPGYDSSTGTFTITLDPHLGEIDLSGTPSRITVAGPGAAKLVVSGGDATRVFEVEPSMTAEIDGITIAHGHASDGAAGSAAGNTNGGNGLSGGGILNYGTLSLSDDLLSHDQAGKGGDGASGSSNNNTLPQSGNGGAAGNGGGVCNLGSVVLNHVTFSDDAAGAGGNGGNGGSTSTSMGFYGNGGNGGEGGSGGAVYSTGPMTASGCTFTDSRAGNGGSGGNQGVSTFTFYQHGSFGIGGNGGNGGGIADMEPAALADVGIGSSSAGNAGGITAQPGSGGGLYLGSTSPSTLQRITITGNTAGVGGAGAVGANPGLMGGNGGGIFSAGPLLIAGGSISNNSAGAGGYGDQGLTYVNNPYGYPSGQGAPGGPGGNGGGIYSRGPVTLTGATILGNAAGAGGHGAPGAPHLNAGGGGPGGTGGTGGVGGGIYCHQAVTITSSTISGNLGGTGGKGGLTADGGPGGKAGGIYAPAGGAFVNDTIAGNKAGPGGAGGDPVMAGFSYPGGNGGNGGDVGAAFLGGVVTFTNTTIAGNAAGAGVPSSKTPGQLSPAGAGGGIVFVSNPFGGDVTLYNTIVAGNTTGAGTPDDISGTLDTHLAGGQAPSSNNLIGTGGSGSLVNGTNGNQVGVADPKLGPLADNGGPTMTMALLAGSLAIDHGSNALALGPDGKPLATDQRGFSRVVNGTVDIGAYEFGSSAPRLPGDANGDGKVDFSDLLILAQNYGKTSGATYSQGDFTGDGAVNFADLLVLAQHYGASGSPTAKRSRLHSSADRTRPHRHV